jgi:hypothetical protein
LDDWSREWDECVIRTRGLWRVGARGQWRRCARDGELEEEKRRRWWRWWVRNRVSNLAVINWGSKTVNLSQDKNQLLLIPECPITSAGFRTRTDEMEEGKSFTGTLQATVTSIE